MLVLRQLSSRLTALTQQISPAILGPVALLRWRLPPSDPQPALLCAEAAPVPQLTPKPSLSAPIADLFNGILLMAAPKKKTSYMRKRIRQAGLYRNRGPHMQSHVSMCPVCERMRMPHRVCDREDCETYFKHRWF